MGYKPKEVDYELIDNKRDIRAYLQWRDRIFCASFSADKLDVWSLYYVSRPGKNSHSRTHQRMRL